jgi:CubicO group peptidase (beta-lactamase class C family)
MRILASALSWLLPLQSLLLAPGQPVHAQTPQPHPALHAAVAAADSIVEAAIAQGVIPGAEMVIAVNGAVVQDRAFGFAQLNDFDLHRLASPRRMDSTTLFDLASVTKVMATTFAMMLLVDQGRLDVDAPVYTYLPDFRGPHRDSITVHHLLTHTAGLAQWQPLYYHASDPLETYRVIRDMPLQWGVGSGYHYSDLGFMLNGYIVERISGEPLDVFLEEHLYGPLGLTHTVFNPRAHGFTDFAATEAGNGYERHMVYDRDFGYAYRGDPASWDGWRQRVDDGEVNDGNAWYANGGVAGHAGLFSTGGDLRVLLDLLNGRGVYRGRRLISAQTVERFLAPNAHLGWMQPKDLPPESFAHGGFTGTYVLGVPELQLSFVLLTNRQNVGVDARGYFHDVAPLQTSIVRTLLAALASK